VCLPVPHHPPVEKYITVCVFVFTMSTKATIAYSDRDGDRFHIYYDYADMRVHLVVDGKEVSLPPSLQGWIYNAWNVVESLRFLSKVASNPSLLSVPPVGAGGGER